MATQPKEPLDMLDLLREPFPPHQISKLPKPTKKQTDDVRADFKKGIRCQICGSWHHPDVIHLDYVGHAALTDRLLDVDPMWSWEPVGFTSEGLPALDRNGGLWIKLTVCGVTRYGYGAADGKQGGDAMKEMIGDALRNAAMRFGAALDLWHKGDLHVEDDGPKADNDSGGLKEQLQESIRQTPRKDLPFPKGPAKNRTELKTLARAFWSDVEGCGDEDELDILLEANKALYAQIEGDLPSWIDGYEKDGMAYPGLEEVLRNKRTELKANAAWRSNPIAAG